MVNGNISHSKTGFTLIEILISISIIFIFSGLAFVAYNKFYDKQEFVTETERVMSILTKLRTNAISGFIIRDACTNGTTTGYAFFLDCESKYYLTFHCTDDNGNRLDPYYENENWKGGIGVTTSLNNEFMYCFDRDIYIKFKSPNGEMEAGTCDRDTNTCTLVSGPVDVIVYDESQNPWQCMRITVYPNGVIQKGVAYADNGTETCPIPPVDL